MLLLRPGRRIAQVLDAAVRLDADGEPVADLILGLPAVGEGNALHAVAAEVAFQKDAE